MPLLDWIVAGCRRHIQLKVALGFYRDYRITYTLYTGIMEKKMEATVYGFRVFSGFTESR